MTYVLIALMLECPESVKMTPHELVLISRSISQELPHVWMNPRLPGLNDHLRPIVETAMRQTFLWMNARRGWMPYSRSPV